MSFAEYLMQDRDRLEKPKKGGDKRVAYLLHYINL